MMQTATGKLSSTSLQSWSLNEVISERTFLYCQLCGAQISLVTQLQSDLDSVIIQELPLEQLLLNLILCAKYSMPFGGRLQLSTSNISIADESYVRLLLNIWRNPPDAGIPQAFDRRWDVKLSRKAMSAIVSLNGGTIAVCQQTEIVSFTEILLPSAVRRQAKTA